MARIWRLTERTSRFDRPYVARAERMLSRINKLMPIHRTIVETLRPLEISLKLSSGIQITESIAHEGKRVRLVTADSNKGSIRAEVDSIKAERAEVRLFREDVLRAKVDAAYHDEDFSFTVAFAFYRPQEFTNSVKVRLVSLSNSELSFNLDIFEKRFALTFDPFAEVTPEIEERVREIVMWFNEQNPKFDDVYHPAVIAATVPQDWRKEFDFLSRCISNRYSRYDWIHPMAKIDWGGVAKFVLSVGGVVGGDMVGSVGGTLIAGAANAGIL
jgi:hypothetical protein